MNTRTQTVDEEVANALSHGIGFLLAVASLPVLVAFAARHSSRGALLGACVFSATMITLYFASAVYHALPRGRTKDWFNRLDHAAIYLFIAGTYTPFALGQLHDSTGWAPFALVWSLALAGMWAKVRNRLRHPLWSTALYMALGWLALVAAAPLLQRLPFDALLLLFGGGLAYTVGAVFFLLDDRVRYGHFVWHLFVLIGSSCHFFATLWHAA
jgi:hemolysin III